MFLIIFSWILIFVSLAMYGSFVVSETNFVCSLTIQSILDYFLKSKVTNNLYWVYRKSIWLECLVVCSPIE